MQPVAKIRLADGKTEEPVALIGSMSDALHNREASR
jgi:hypothetical protein